jgi:3-hydroxyisobutyrate dehydrogenase-like beta-hydroxyacid dehydrogenase
METDRGLAISVSGSWGMAAKNNFRQRLFADDSRRNRSRAPADLAANAGIVFACLPSSAEVEAAVLDADGLLAHFRRGMIHVDSTTAEPNSTRRLGALYAERGCAMVDAPLGRTPKEAEEGRLNTFVGGDPEAVATVKPVIASYADTVIEAGPLGSGHTLKLVNNFISIGTSAVIAEAVATAAKLGADLRKLFEVVSSGGANSAMFQMVMPWVSPGACTVP